MGPALRLTAAHLRKKANQSMTASRHQSGEARGDRVAREPQGQTPLECERISRSQAGEHRAKLMFLAPECSVQGFVVMLRRVERGDDLGLEKYRCPRYLRLNHVELGGL